MYNRTGQTVGACDLAFTLHSGCLRSKMKNEEDILVSGTPVCFYYKSEINVYPVDTTLFH